MIRVSKSGPGTPGHTRTLTVSPLPGQACVQGDQGERELQQPHHRFFSAIQVFKQVELQKWNVPLIRPVPGGFIGWTLSTHSMSRVRLSLPISVRSNPQVSQTIT